MWQAKRSGSIAVGDQLISLNGEPLSAGGSLDAQIAAIPVGVKVRLEVSKPTYMVPTKRSKGRRPSLSGLKKGLSRKLSRNKADKKEREQPGEQPGEGDPSAPAGGWL